MAGKILKSILTVAAAVLLAGCLVIAAILYRDFTFIQHDQLKDKLLLAAAAVETMGRGYLEELPPNDCRLTWISEEGVVLFDSLADPESMTNHADREEIREARSVGSGSSVRYSDTLTEKTFYEAVLLSDGSVLRISVSRDSAAALAVEMLQPIVLIAAAAILLSVWLAHRMAGQVVEPLNRLNLDDPLSNDTYEELTPLLHRLDSQRQEIELQMQLLQRKQQEFDQIADNMREVLVLLDPELRILSINPAAVRLFGMTASPEGRRFSAGGFEPEMSRALTAAGNEGHAEFTSSVGERRYLFTLRSVGSGDVLHGIVLLGLDVTEQAQAERMRHEFTANVTHELKTPLHAIIGSAELMENGIVRTEDLPRFVGHIRKEASRLLKLIEDILRLAQLDEGNAMPEEEVSLKAAAEEVREVLSAAAAEKEVSVTVSGSSGTVTGVPGLLFELVYNLADNAVRYNRPGGSVRITVSEDGERAVLCVADTGVGIPPEHQSKIFERFYRVDKSHSRKSGGTGLGLSIAKHAVKYHGGTITVDSRVDCGTSVTVELKKTRTAPPAPKGDKV